MIHEITCADFANGRELKGRGIYSLAFALMPVRRGGTRRSHPQDQFA
jgi:hypothetical protein